MIKEKKSLRTAKIKRKQGRKKHISDKNRLKPLDFNEHNNI